MKKTSLLILSLATLVSLAGCMREDNLKDSAENGGVQEVTTQFVLNVASAPQTKMTAAAVQQAGNFRGIDNGVILAYRTEMHNAPSDPVPYVLKTKAADWADDAEGAKVKRYDLGLLLGDGTLYNDGSLDPNTHEERYNATNQSRRVLQLSIPVGTDAIMVYGKAARGNSDKDADYGGTLTVQKENPAGNTGSVISDIPGNTVFKAKKILETTESYDQTAALMIFIINNILSRGVAAYTDPTFGYQAALTWAEVGHQYEYNKMGGKSRYPMSTVTTQVGLEEILGRCYYDFTYIKPSDAYIFDEHGNPTSTVNPQSVRPNGEYRAGSSYSIQMMIIDMYKVITAAAGATPTSGREAQVKRLAKTILDRAEVFFDKDDQGRYKDLDVIQSLAQSNNIISEDEWNAKYALAKDLNKYPYEDYGIPEGAAQLGFFYQNQVVSDTEVQLQNIPSSAYTVVDDDYVKINDDLFFYYHPNKPLVNPTMTEFEPRKYLYPAELWYYVNSPIRTTSKESLLVSDYPNGVNPWNADASWTAGLWDFPGMVVSSTRGVAVKNNINYGVAMLKSAVICTESGDLEDNRAVMTNNAEDNRTFTWDEANISLRGILIGGVNPRMNWQFVRRYKNATEAAIENNGDLSLFDGVIYDHSLPSTTIPQTTNKDEANWNYTLVYDNYNSSKSATEQNNVYVSLEFVNNGPAFWGRDNYIRSGSVFYLVGELKSPTSTQISGIVWPTDHEIPPLYGVDGEETGTMAPGSSKKIARIFIQDFVTEAVFKIGKTSLQKAYYSVPDLRAVEMSLGLSVDLKWEMGIKYEIDL